MTTPVVTLREITGETVRTICELEPHEAQSGFVAPNAVSIAQAHFNPDAVFWAIYAGDEPVGFIMWRPEDDGASCFLWRFMIDGRHQGKGYGREAIALWLEGLPAQGYTLARLSYVPGAAGPHGFYLARGFQDTGETRANGERLMELAL
ncbi:GNAT family N-acetyltransferase [Bosea vestrisii]|uniref:GNAT family N-acetyltransferase n=1 Tax=Bosea vestrisii TaxID=151416 RepID=UPI0024DF4F00|nr:GNAT family N-acetyltransferase [Bosea vestrisii]WID97217.1 GNAT family N-acetyltransferase [Bosea vestrisii]